MEQWLLRLLIVLLMAAGMALLIRKYFLCVTQVSSHSMLPTCQPRDRLLTLRVYHPENLNRGEIIVFYSHELEMTMIKRLIGLPGDMVQIKMNGELLVNGNKQAEPYIKYSGGKGGSYLVSEGQYFFLGDNRSESNDSRHWKKSTIPAQDIHGKVTLSLWPFHRV